MLLQYSKKLGKVLDTVIWQKSLYWAFTSILPISKLWYPILGHIIVVSYMYSIRTSASAINASEQRTHLNLSILLHCTTSCFRQHLEITSSFVDLAKSKQSVGSLKTSLSEKQRGKRERESERVCVCVWERSCQRTDFFLWHVTLVISTWTRPCQYNYLFTDLTDPILGILKFKRRPLPNDFVELWQLAKFREFLYWHCPWLIPQEMILPTDLTLSHQMSVDLFGMPLPHYTQVRQDRTNMMEVFL